MTARSRLIAGSQQTLEPIGHPPSAARSTQAQHGDSQLTLCVFIDGFGWELLKRHSFLDDVLTVKSPLQTVFGYSSTCDPTILTGQLPRDHGHFSFFRFAPDQSPFSAVASLRHLPAWLTGRSRVRHWISRGIGRALGYTGYFQLYNMPFKHLALFDYTEKRDLYMPGGINGGQLTIFDHLRRCSIPFHMSDWRRTETDNLAAAATSIARGQVRFAYLYLAGLDGLMHTYGTSSPRVAQKLHWYDRQLRLIIDGAEKRYGSVRLLVFSDHGMADVTDSCDLMSRISKLGFHFGEDYAAVYDSTMARFWFRSPDARRAIIHTLRSEPLGRVLSDDDLHAWGCDFHDRRYGDLFYLLNTGVLLCPSFMGRKPIAGMHGYDPTHPDSLAMFASNALIDPMPKGLGDLCAVMKSEAGVSA